VVHADGATNRFTATRAALVTADPLQVALGRPNREQVVTSRSSTATTLQALELTNGAELAGLFRQGAERLLEGTAPGDSTAIVARVYEQALSRKPTRQEARLAASLVGASPTPAGVEDLLWVVTMLPEFQLIY
jgi:hypothetical protein